jgi:hypothetical protein
LIQQLHDIEEGQKLDARSFPNSGPSSWSLGNRVSLVILVPKQSLGTRINPGKRDFGNQEKPGKTGVWEPGETGENGSLGTRRNLGAKG